MAVVGWNVFQHMQTAHKPKPTDIKSPAAAEYYQPGKPVMLGVAGPAPEGQGLPPPTSRRAWNSSSATPRRRCSPLRSHAIPAGAAFNPSGPIYGAEPDASAVILKVRKPASVVLRSPDGVTVVFAKQLAAGEAYRAPLQSGNLVVDVSDPFAFEVYCNGSYCGGLQATVTPLGQLNSKAASLAAQAEAQAAAAAKANPTQADEAPPSGGPDTQPGAGI